MGGVHGVRGVRGWGIDSSECTSNKADDNKPSATVDISKGEEGEHPREGAQAHPRLRDANATRRGQARRSGIAQSPPTRCSQCTP